MSLVILFLHHLLLCLGLTTFMWTLYLITKKTSIIDIYWALGFVILIVYDFFMITSFNYTSFAFLFISVLTLWSLRLSLFLFITRIMKTKRDTRYDYLQQKWKNALSVLYNFWFQGFIQALVSVCYIPLFITPFSDHYLLPWLMGLAFLCLCGEHIADYQLYSFSKTEKNKTICMNGLWFYSRHPNYFFELLFWFILSAFIFLGTQSFVTWVGPIILFIIMRFVTGKISEKVSISSRGNAYREYIKSTPMIIPNFFKRRKV